MACYNTYNRTGSRTAEKVRESELDLFLNQKYDEIVKDLEFSGDIAKIFDLNPQQITINKINQIKKITTEIKRTLEGTDGESSKLHEHPGYMGITEFITDPISGIAEPFDRKDQWQKKVDLYKKDHTEEEAIKMANAVAES